MKPDLLDILLCPECQAPDLKLKEHLCSYSEVKEGDLLCERCGRKYPIINYVPRFVRSDGYANSFSYQWRNFPENRYRLGAEPALERFNLNSREWIGKRILDAGCGSGRFSEFFSRCGAEVYALDLSNSVDQAVGLCGLRPNVHILQASLLKIPFREALFDLVFSFGVLHHTPDTRKAFMQLPRFVKPGGKLAVFVYSKWSEAGSGRLKAKEHLSDFYRRFTPRLPHHLLHAISYLAIPIYDLKRLPKFGPMLDLAIETSMNPHWRIRVVDTFDWYSPKYQWKHSRGEVISWFREAGFNELFVSSHPVSVVGSKV